MSNPYESNRYEAVVFDIGGVIVGSPLHAIAAFEAEHGIPHNTVNRHVAASAPDGAWHRLERGELPLGAQFYEDFDTELAALGFRMSSAKMMAAVSAISAQPRAEMIDAVARLRALGFKVAALTNNWNAAGEDTDTGPTEPGRMDSGEDDEGRARHRLEQYFDVFVESAVLGLRKPDPRIYLHTCSLLRVEPREAVFLDDIGTNLKAARALGMATIKVDQPEVALSELWTLLGISRTN